MAKNRFSHLMNEFAKLVNGQSITITNKDAVIFVMDGIQFRIEDGNKIGSPKTYLIMAKLNHTLNNDIHAMKLNGNFEVTGNGYIAILDSDKLFYIHSCVVPEHPLEIINLLKEIVINVNKVNDEIANHVVS